jgi:Na+-driven multidrug efflux pump
VFVPLAYWVGIVLDGGLTWAWAAGGVHVLLLAVALVWRFRSGAWRHIVI